jgi:hypothetical protein
LVSFVKLEIWTQLLISLIEILSIRIRIKILLYEFSLMSYRKHGYRDHDYRDHGYRKLRNRRTDTKLFLNLVGSPKRSVYYFCVNLRFGKFRSTRRKSWLISSLILSKRWTIPFEAPLIDGEIECLVAIRKSFNISPSNPPHYIQWCINFINWKLSSENSRSIAFSTEEKRKKKILSQTI